MGSTEPYATARSVEAAIKNAAKRAAKAEPSLSTSTLIQLEYFNRLLSRVFSEGDESDWVLKGGTGILARVPSSRSTRDIDLDRRGFNLDESLEELRRLASIDLHDHFRFEYVSHEPTLATDTQLYMEGHRVTFNVFLGVAEKGVVNVDLVSGSAITDTVQTVVPKLALDLPRLDSRRYRLYPVVDQIADKVCATMAEYNGRPSSREKDLVDIVVFAVTQNVEGAALIRAIETERRRRNLMSFKRFVVPRVWGAGYVAQSRHVPHCADYSTIDLAAGLAARLIDPALTGEVQGMHWYAADQRWS